MKKFLTAVAMALLLVGCAKETVDLSGINEKLAELDNRVSALEGAIASIQSAIGDGVFVQKVEQYADPETGKTIGVTVTYTSGKVVYFEISPKADYSGPVLSVIRSGEGSLVWAVDGVAVKVDGKEVPVNKTPTFTIDEDGYLWVSIDGGDPVKLGPVKSEGASLVDGIFKDIKVEQDKVVLVLSDDSIVNIPFAAAFKLVIEQTEYLNDGGKAITIPYTVTGKTEATEVNVTGYDPDHFYVEVTDENIIITPLNTWSSAKMLAYADSKVGLTSMVTIEVNPEYARIVDPIADADTHANYVVECEGGSLEMHVVSNVEIEAKVQEDCDWITIVSTKAKTYTITATVAENTGLGRWGNVQIFKKGTEDEIQEIYIFQAKTSAVTNLSKNGSANSYIVTKPGDFKLKAVKGNSDESVGTVAKAEVLWETYNTDQEVEAKSVIAAVGVDGEFITFSTPDYLQPGNALIAAKDASDKILWSWHIWIPKTVPTSATYGLSSTVEMMDRNLGALDAPQKDSEDAQNAGLFYQWGRKDPLRAVSSIAEGTMAKTAPADVWKESSTQLTAANMHETPCVFIKGSEDWISESDATLWASAKTINDPCPVGYKVAKREETKLFDYFTPDDSWKGWSIDDTKNYFTVGKEENSYAVFPFGHYSRSGSYDLKGDGAAWFWTATDKGGETASTQARTMVLSVKDAKLNCSGQKKANGAYVRCIVDPNAPQPDPTVDLSEKGTANSYIVSEAGDFKFKAVKGNSTESVGTIDKVELVWETNNTATAPDANGIIAKVGKDDNYITFSTPATLVPGNALIAAKDADGKILWSWHIWIPKTEVKTLDAGFAGEKAILDRNLGALIVTPTTDKALESEGLYYQWGRKDPLLGEKITAVPADVVKQFVKDVQTDVATAIQNPVVFYYNEGKDWLATPDATLWDNEGKKTIYDPCPVGYKVPAYNTSLDMWNKLDNETFPTKWTYDETNGYVKFTTGTATFPLCGYVNGSSQSISGYGKRSLVWSSAAKSETHGSGMFIRENKYISDGNHKSCGASVRCIAE
jgi:uncharacterized protein (TIGR02145 family)